MHIHCLGIGGIGLSALARWLHQQGHTVTGTDQSLSSLTQQLIRENIAVTTPNADCITAQIDWVIYSEAVPTTAPERQQAQKLGIKTSSYFEAMGEQAQSYQLVAVAGSHGKTTTTALAATALHQTDLSPTVICGSLLPGFKNKNFVQGSSDWLVVEACEYRENFRFLSPRFVLLTNVEWDHPDSFPTQQSYFEAFAKFIKSAEAVIFPAHLESALQPVLANFRGKQILAPPLDESVQLKVLGEFNRTNASLVVALGEHLQLDISALKQGLTHYSGAARRQECIGQRAGVEIFSDYAHHPTEVTKTITAFREKYDANQVGFVFQPHQFARTRQLWDDFVAGLRNQPNIALWPIYPSRDPKADQDPQLIFKLAEQTQLPVVSTIDQLEAWQQETALSALVFLGAGDIDSIARDWIKS